MRGLHTSLAAEEAAATWRAITERTGSCKHACRRCHSSHRQRSRQAVQAVNVAELQAATPSTSERSWDSVRADFSILDQSVNGKPLIYLDSGATSQKPRAVTDALDHYYARYNSNVHRGVHHLSSQATAAFEAARQKVSSFVNARSSSEIVFTKNATEGINLVAHSWANQNLKPGDEILVSVAEHHANMVPWQMAAKRTGAVLKHVPLTPDTQEIDMQAFKEMISPRTKLVALVYVSNMLGAVTRVHDVVAEARKVGAKVLLDACQAVPNMPVDVQSLGADFIVASAHKMCGPTGIGFLWGRSEVLEGMPPFQGGGEMIDHVGLQESTYAPPPGRFEAGTPAIAEAIGFGAAVDYLSELGMARVQQREAELGGYLYQQLRGVNGVTIYGPPPENGRAALCSFNVEGLHASDVSTLLDHEGVAVRAGHHCTQPLHEYLGMNATARASLYIYNTHSEIDAFIQALKSTIKFFNG
ncbi:hypothetical protein WJX73_000408 [Symbiochloris irregularis]|uniref:cysteine desulfurase n=1 Tax=Symbiochloris irregularis TaxID=706552 RepID=A0AAW1NTA6_9CHLO